METTTRPDQRTRNGELPGTGSTSIGFRWKARYTVLAVLFVTWVVSFVDRMVISVAIPYIAADFGLTPFRMGVVMSVFFTGYSIAQVPGGLLSDKFGARRVATLAMLWWSAFTAITGAAANLSKMLVARFLFGLGEGVFPACGIKAIAVWFPKQERATAKGIMLASNPLGKAITPIIAVWIMSHWGWRACFYFLFLPGIVVAFLFWKFVADQPSKSSRVSPQELIEIEGEKTSGAAAIEEKVSYWTLFKSPLVLRLFVILLTFDFALWGFSTWLPTYLVKARGFSMAQMGIAASLPFFAGTVAIALGGWVSDRFFPQRRTVPLIATQLLSALFLYLTLTANSLVMLLVCQTLAGAFIQTFISAFWALPYNLLPKSVIGTAGGFINMGGQIAALIAPLLIGYLVGASGGKFHSTFAFLIGAILLSCAIVVFSHPGRIDAASASTKR